MNEANEAIDHSIYHLGRARKAANPFAGVVRAHRCLITARDAYRDACEIVPLTLCSARSILETALSTPEEDPGTLIDAALAQLGPATPGM